MKVDIVTGQIKYVITGTERFLNEVALYLTEKGVNTTLLEIKKEGKNLHINPNYKKLKKKYEPVKKRLINKRELNVPGLHTSFFFLRNLPTDSILYLPSNIYVHLPNIITKPPKQKYIIGSHVLQFYSYYQSARHTALERNFNKLIKRTLKLRWNSYKKTLFFHAINLQQKFYLEQEFGIRPENIIYAPIFARVEQFKIGKNNSIKLRVLHIGGIGKNAKGVIKIIDELIKRKQIGEYEFHFIGKSEPEELRTLAGLYPSNVINHGMADDSEKIKVYMGSDVLIVPSIEAFPLIVLEGLSAGLIIVSRENSINKEMIELGADIVNVNEETPETFVIALEKVRQAKKKGELTQSRKEKNRDIVLKNFSYDVVMPKVFDMFEKVYLS